MKKSLIFSALACGIMLLASCAGSAIKMAADRLDSVCPKQINEFITMDHVSYKNQVMTINYTFDDSITDIDSLFAVSDVIKNTVMLRLQSDDEMKEFIQVCDEAEAVINNIYTGRDSGKTFEILINKEDIQKILEGSVTPNDVVENAVEQDVEEAAENTVEDGENIIDDAVKATEVEMQNKD